MACPDATELARFALGTLAGDAAAAIRLHVDECATCRAASSALVSVSRGEAPENAVAWKRPQLAAGDALDRFIISRELGEGAASVVYAAYDPDLDRNVALKLLRSRGGSVDDKLLREGRALAKISHPNVVSVFEVGDAKGQLYIALELVEGVTARQWIAIEKRPWRAVRDVIVAAGRGLAALHRAGLVHRDVKPDNIVVNADRVRLVDFGLVGAGVGAGTPTYMAPEREADDRSDQYSLAATYAELVGGVAAIAAPQRLAVPRRIRAAVARGLATDPAARFGSVEGFVAALADRPRWPLAIAAAGALAVPAVWFAVSSSRSIGSPCDDAPVAWTRADRAATVAAFAADAWPFAADVRARAVPELDAFATAWSGARAGVCRAYHEQHALSGERFDLEVACLERQRRAFTATVGTLRGGSIDKAIELVAALPPLAQCSDAETLARVEPLPVDPAKRGAIAAIESELAHAKVAQRAGDPTKAQQLATRALTAARAAGYRPAIAEGAYRLADLLERSGDTAGATPLVDEAIRVSAEARLDATEAESWILQLVLRGLDGDAKDDELAAARRAGEAAAVRARDPRISAALANVLGLVAKNRGDYAGARDHFTTALETLRAATLDGAEVAATLGNLSNVLPMLGDLAGARRAAQEASKRDLEMFGAQHPAYADSLVQVGRCDADAGDFAAATTHQLAALAIIEATYGDDSPAAMTVHNNLVSSLAQGHHLADARLHAERALTLAEKLRGPEHPATAVALFTVANVAGEANDWKRADDYAQRALALATKIYGPSHPLSASIIVNLGAWALRRGDAKAAEAYLRRGLVGMAAMPDSPDMAVVRTSLGSALAAQGRHAEAITQLEAALALREKIGDDAVAIGDTQSTLARSLWATGKRPRAIALAKAAGAAFAQAGESASRYAHDLDVWRTTNHVK